MFATLDASLLLADIVIVFVEAALAVIVKLVVSVLSIESVVPSIVTPALAFTSRAAELIVTVCPVPFRVNDPSVEVRVIPLPPSRVSNPEAVVKLDADPAFILTPAVVSISRMPASISTTEFAFALPSICTAVPFS